MSIALAIQIAKTKWALAKNAEHDQSSHGNRGGGGGTANDELVSERAKDLEMPLELFEQAIELRENGMSWKDIVSEITENSLSGRKWFNSDAYTGNTFNLRQDLEEAIDPPGDPDPDYPSLVRRR